MIVKLLTECHLGFLSLKGGCIGSCQNGTLLEISCHGSIIMFFVSFESLMNNLKKYYSLYFHKISSMHFKAADI